MSKKQILKKLDRVNVLIDKRILANKPYKGLAVIHHNLIRALNK